MWPRGLVKVKESSPPQRRLKHWSTLARAFRVNLPRGKSPVASDSAAHLTCSESWLFCSTRTFAVHACIRLFSWNILNITYLGNDDNILISREVNSAVTVLCISDIDFRMNKYNIGSRPINIILFLEWFLEKSLPLSTQMLCKSRWYSR